MIIIKQNERVPVRIGEVTFWISPLSHGQKLNMVAVAVTMQGGAEIVDNLKMSILAIKYSVKQVEGLSRFDGSAYELEFDESGESLTDECAQELLQIEGNQGLIAVCSRFANQIKDYKIPGVEIDFKGTKSISKKNSPISAS